MLSHIVFIVVAISCVIADYPPGSPPATGNVVDAAVHDQNAGSAQFSATGNVPGGGFNAPPPMFDFKSALSNYFEQMQRFHQEMANNANSFAYSTSDLNSKVKAESSLNYDQGLNSIKNLQQNIISQSGFPNFGGAGFGAGNAGGYGGSFSGAFPPGTQGSFASGSVGPGGSYQTAAVFPENPSMPNVVNRFSENIGPQGQQQGNQGEGFGADGKPYFYGVMSSSASSSSNVDGKVREVHHAQTTINDNGKITTYEAKNP